MDIGFDEVEIDIIVGVHSAKENLAAASRQIHPDLGINSQRVTSSLVREHQSTSSGSYSISGKELQS
jgi:hypothetical protein